MSIFSKEEDVASDQSATAAHSLSVTAIIPTFNRSHYLGETIRSLLDQTHPIDQFIVVDDGSTDHTAQIVESFGGSVAYLRKANGGKSSAMNLGLTHATGELIWIFDDDDVAERTALSRFVRALKDNPDCGFAYGNYDHFTTSITAAWQTDASVFRVSDRANLYVALLEFCFVFQPGMLVRRSCYDTVGLFDETLIRSQDYEMLLRLARRFPGVAVDGITFHQRHHAGTRGTAQIVISDAEKGEAWRRYDQRYFSTIYHSLALSEYLPHEPGSLVPPDTELAPGARFTALIQRCCVMAKRGLWDLAANDLQQAATLSDTLAIRSLSPAHRNMLFKVLDAYWNGPIDIAQAERFHRAIDGFSNSRLRRQIRSALMGGLIFHVRRSVLRKDKRTFMQCVAAYRSLATPGALAGHVVGRLLRRGASSARGRKRRRGQTTWSEVAG